MPKVAGEKLNFDKLKTAVEALFPNAEDVSVSTTKVDSVTYCRVAVENMFDYIKLDYKTMMRLAELFGTTDFNVDNWNQAGCETCDFGSKYVHVFEWKL